MVSVVGQIGAVIGGTTVGYLSTFFGRRLAMMVSCIFGGALVPAYIFPRSMKLVATCFFEQFFVGAVWGPIPIHLSELSPPAMRATMLSFTYQLGNLASSASSTIEATIGQRFPLPDRDGVAVYDYGKVIGIYLGAVWAYQLFFLFWGPEMSEDERAEYGASADDLEILRKQGVSLAEIGAQRAKATLHEREAGSDDHIETIEEKVGDAEHREDTKEMQV